jgi:hypothetical protein
MSTLKDRGSVVKLLNGHTAAGEASPAVTRDNYMVHTVYVTNPDAVPVNIELSPNGTDWFTLNDADSTDTSIIFHLEYLTKYLRITRGAGAGTVDAWVVSGSPAYNW